ncbi:MAG: DMT family transporter [Gammaproteobacteria bacterium]|nr:DMT family transporter [Gammaproteobacteria bacterium]
MSTYNHPVRAAVWMLGAMISFTVMAIAGRALAGHLDTFEIMLYRSLLGIVIVLGGAHLAGTWQEINTRRMPLQIVRNLCHFAGQNLWLYAVALIPLSQLFAFEFTTPLWVAAFAPLILGEKWTATRLMTCLIGFLGILVVARPDVSELNLATLAAALCAVGFAGATLGTKRLSTTQSVTCILFWLVALQAIFGLVIAGFDGHITPLNSYTFPWAMLVGICGLAAHFCITNALKIAPATVVMPLEFLRLPLIAVVGYLLYNEELLLSVFVGAGFILAANIINIRTETRNTAEQTPAG